MAWTQQLFWDVYGQRHTIDQQKTMSQCFDLNLVIWFFAHFALDPLKLFQASVLRKILFCRCGAEMFCQFAPVLSTRRGDLARERPFRGAVLFFGGRLVFRALPCFLAAGSQAAVATCSGRSIVLQLTSV